MKRFKKKMEASMHRKSRNQSQISWSFGSMALPLFLLAATAGCGGAEATVSGTVTLDGSPLEQGTVMFVPTQPGKAQAATGVISGGDYWVQVAKTGGLFPGEYRVRITASARRSPTLMADRLLLASCSPPNATPIPKPPDSNSRWNPDRTASTWN